MAVVIDVRNNNGGFVNVYAIDVFARRSYFNMTPRGFSVSPSRSVLGQRALELADDSGDQSSHAFRRRRFHRRLPQFAPGQSGRRADRRLDIYTSGVQLIDGSNLRLPYDRITANDGTLMEMHPRPVDMPVAKPIGESLKGRDSQLEAAANELLKDIGKATTVRTRQ
jgi:hypothetical protein